MNLRILAPFFVFYGVISIENWLRADEDFCHVVGLRCEYLTDPLGIDVAQPRLTWRMESADPTEPGLRQTAYQILVASNSAQLDSDVGDFWDSGRTETDQSALVEYDGKPLSSQALCYWKVRVWDENGRASPWSRPAKWSMGLLSPADWKAQWIGVENRAVEAKNDPWFRKTFPLAARPVRATVYVASLGYHELYINEKKVGDRVLSPSISDLSQRVRYVTLDVTEYLKAGVNTVALWCAPGWADFAEFKVQDKPLVMAELEVIPSDGPPMRVVTDATWKTRMSPLSPIGGWVFWNFGGERYDAAKELPRWSSPQLDDSSWQSAAVFTPNVKLSAELIEPNRRLETLEPVEITSPAPGQYRVDMGRNHAGWFEIRMKGSPGQRVSLQFAERPDQAMTYNQASEFVFGDSGEGTFCHRFNYAAFRWVTISGLSAAPSKEDIRGYLISTDVARVGRFECSDPFFNRLYEMSLWTFRSLSLGGYTVDCPHRERLGYGGDAHATMETALTNFGMGAFYTKWLADWRDVQRPDGDLPYTAPTRGGGGGPAWGGICVTLPWQVYLHYGDRRILHESYPTMQRWIGFLQSKAKNHLLQKWGGEWDFLGDWVPPGKGQNVGERVDERSTWLFNNCYYCDSMATIAKIAKLLGKTDDAAAYSKEAEAIAHATHQEFLNADKNSYASGEQLYEAMPLLMGVVPESFQTPVMDRLEHEIAVVKNGHIDTGIHGTAYLLKLLLERNRNDLVFLMANQRTYPGWGNMLDQGATTLWEQWDGQNSRLHSSFVSIGSWFIEGIAGIRLDPRQPGYKHFMIRPSIVGDLRWARGEIDSLYGKITSEWKLSDGQLLLTVDVPPNTSATIYVPANDPASVMESGKPAGEAPGVKLVGTADLAAIYEVQSGHYAFSVRSLPSRSRTKDLQ
jgi:hypothetical protein